MMQPLLLLKQTLLATVDPGGLLVQGPLLKMASGEVWHRDTQAKTNFQLDMSFGFAAAGTASFQYRAALDGIRLFFAEVESGPDRTRFAAMEPQEAIPMVRFLPFPFPSEADERKRRIVGEFATILQRLIHLPSVRTLKSTQVAPGKPQTIEDRFDSYVAPIVRTWQEEGKEEFQRLQAALRFLSLHVRSEYDFEGQPQVQVTVFPEEVEHRRVFTRPSQVGFGIVQALPIVVALLYAEPGDMVHIEEPEAHLHPKAQIAIMSLIADTATRGVRVVIETHSSLMLREVQTLVASGALSPNDVRLHWFQRDPASFETRVTSASLDSEGTFGDWPEDFDEVNLDSEKRFLDATFSRSER
jgi:hypothetical protein